MNPRLRKVTQIPMKELWRPTGLIIGRRIRMLTMSEVSELLRTTEVEFVVADVGRILRWIDVHDCFDFWKREVKARLVEDGSRFVLDAFPGAYCYAASQWENEKGGASIVLLERHH